MGRHFAEASKNRTLSREVTESTTLRAMRPSHSRALRVIFQNVIVCVLWGTLVASSRPQSNAPVAVIPIEGYLRAQSAVRVNVEGQPGRFMFDTGEGVTAFSPAFAAKIGCRPWGRITGFRMTGERLNNAHCDDVTFELGGQSFLVPVVSTMDVMAIIGPEAPSVDGTIGLDLFAGRTITIVPRQEIILESPESMAERVKNAKEMPIRMVRDVEGISLTVNAAVETSLGRAWMELDNGNGGSLIIANHIAPLIGMNADVSIPEPIRLRLAGGITVEGNARSRDLIMDGNIGAQFLNNWILTMDLLHGRAWLSTLPTAPVTR